MKPIDKLDKIVVRYIFLIAGLVLAIFNYQLIFAWIDRIFTVFLPILSGLAIAYVLNILMVRYEKLLTQPSTQKWIKPYRRPIAILLSIVTIILVLLFVLGLVLPQVYNVLTEVISAVPFQITRLEETVTNFEKMLPSESMEFLGRFQLDWADILKNVQDWGNRFITSVVNTTLSTVGSLTTIIINGVVAFIFSIYLLLSKEKLLDQFLRLVTTYTSKPVARRIFYVLTTIDDSFKHFFTGAVIDATILGILVTTGMWIFRFPYAGMIGSLTGFFALVPMLGAYISGAIGAILISVHSVPQALWFIIFVICVQQFEGNVIYPRVVGGSIGLPGMWVLFAVTIGGGLFGVPGMLLGVPLASAFYKIVKRDVLERERYSYEERQKLLHIAKYDSFKQVADDTDQTSQETN
ncbi:AI-2E family transporter [Facklamia miroungae]|uniref:Predicted PurR-regulated permease PerM n=1 Tax=Facklamia miroungae TaxID=120956 RepID=A0A1G7P2G0_9LACT|nr:AI-2E family transporter [Facklamia miroungae]NKZ28557.1 AI-2E family transporter [Facklamia miroungae]SDF80414.1 Predicted PurR-regulated permease PerM [Facklamia miroungae]